jgi:hypothetical protein
VTLIDPYRAARSSKWWHIVRREALLPYLALCGTQVALPPSALTLEFPADDVDHHGVRSHAVPVVVGQCSLLLLSDGVGVHPTQRDSAWTVNAGSATA